MKIIRHILASTTLALLYALLMPLHAQQKGWIQTEAFDNRYFIENKGQFDFLNGYNSEKVLYAIKGNGVYVLFTKNGINYRFAEIQKTEIDEDIKNKKIEERLKKRKINYSYTIMKWEGADEKARIDASDQLSFYHTYADPSDNNSSGFMAHSFKKITYKNIYPNIDVEYFFTERKDGFKYNIILHAGADPGKIKQFYTGIQEVKTDPEGNLLIKTRIGDITDQHPVLANRKHDISYRVEGNHISFSGFPEGKINEDLIIDPFTTVPNFTQSPKAYDVDFDYQGNVYVYGGVDNGLSPNEFIKFNTNGAIQWKHVTFQSCFYNFYGDFAINRCTGSIFISEGFCNPATIEKLNSNGQINAIYSGHTDQNEMWRIENFNCSGKILIGNQGTMQNSKQFTITDTLLGTFNFYSTLLANNGSGNDVISVCQDKQGYFYLHFMEKKVPVFTNYIASGLMLNPLPLKFLVKSNHHFQESSSIQYNFSAGNSYTNGFNGLCVNDNFLYSYDGATIRQWDKTLGTLQRQIKVIPTDSFAWGGLDVDSCNILYAGVEKTVQVFDANLLLINTLYLKDTVYDLRIYKNKLYACGKGFVTQVDIPLPDCIPDSIITTSSLEVPNVFSPNGDGKNDFFKLKMKGIQSLNVKIYNRWGLIVSEYSDINTSWDGKNKQGRPVPDGTYYYIINASGVDGKEYQLPGFLELIR